MANGSGAVHHDGRFLYLIGPRGFIEPGMSGSPILDENGAAIGLVSTGDGPSLIDCLPPWLSRRLDRAESIDGRKLIPPHTREASSHSSTRWNVRPACSVCSSGVVASQRPSLVPMHGERVR